MGRVPTAQEFGINYGKTRLKSDGLITLSPNHAFPLVNPPPSNETSGPNLGGILEQSTRVTPIGKLNTLVNKIERLHSTEASKGLLEMGWKPGSIP